LQRRTSGRASKGITDALIHPRNPTSRPLVRHKQKARSNHPAKEKGSIGLLTRKLIIVSWISSISNRYSAVNPPLVHHTPCWLSAIYIVTMIAAVAFRVAS
jgi:hypothetical protein